MEEKTTPTFNWGAEVFMGFTKQQTSLGGPILVSPYAARLSRICGEALAGKKPKDFCRVAGFLGNG